MKACSWLIHGHLRSRLSSPFHRMLEEVVKRLPFRLVGTKSDRTAMLLCNSGLSLTSRLAPTPVHVHSMSGWSRNKLELIFLSTIPDQSVEVIVELNSLSSTSRCPRDSMRDQDCHNQGVWPVPVGVLIAGGLVNHTRTWSLLPRAIVKA